MICYKQYGTVCINYLILICVNSRLKIILMGADVVFILISNCVKYLIYLVCLKYEIEKMIVHFIYLKYLSQSNGFFYLIQ